LLSAEKALPKDGAVVITGKGLAALSEGSFRNKLITHVCARPLQDQTHRERVYRSLSSRNAVSFFIRSHHKLLSVAKIALESLRRFD